MYNLPEFQCEDHNSLKVLIPLPSFDFDPSEVAIPWKYLRSNGYDVQFATPNGKPGVTDPRMFRGVDLGLLKSTLMADSNGVRCFEEVLLSEEFNNPICYENIDTSCIHGLVLPGGHAKGMKVYLESKCLQQKVVEMFESNKPCGAICHGTVLACRSTSASTGKSVLYGRKTTGLTKIQELVAFNLTRLYLGDYYLTYPITVEDEVRSTLQDKDNDFLRGNDLLIPLGRDSPENTKPGFVVKDGNYLSARWPGDAHLFSVELLRMLHNHYPKCSTQNNTVDR